MTTAAGSSSTLQPLDPFKQARYPLSFAGEKRKADTYASIQYNHKPHQSSQKRKTTLKRSADDPEICQLSIRDTNDEGDGPSLYRYRGQSSSGQDVYAVLLDPQTRKCVLAPVSSQYAFNLISTPEDKDAAKLQRRYDQIKPHEPAGLSSDAEDDLFGDGEDQPSDDGSDAEASFFDWRNFVPPGQSTSPDRQHGTPRSAAVSAQNTPLLNAQRVQSSLSSKPKPQPRSQNEPSKPDRKDVFKPRKQAASPLVAPTRKTAPLPARKVNKANASASTPDIRIERRASTRPQPSEDTIPEHADEDDDAAAEHGASSTTATTTATRHHPPDQDEHDNADDNEDDDDLVLDFDAPTRPSKRPSAFGLAAAAASSGPISLRSAASSPGSRLGSPALRQQQYRPAADGDDDDDGDDDMGLEIEVPDAGEEADGGGVYTFDDGDEEDEDEVEQEEHGEEGRRRDMRGADSDVDELELPSPAAEGTRQTGREGVLSPQDEMEEDENVDLEAEMLQALASDEDEDDGGAPDAGMGVMVAQEESESESEAE
ncbi:MAG: hypothetical protein M1822_007164 [Bathelium mastoideum]|nr:MAG: hypothetical protein M1822_007164 [Bathelium mastoideum]